MLDTGANDQNGIAFAEDAARNLFDNGHSSSAPTYEPQNREEADAAVRQLARSFDELPGTIARVLDAARDTGELLSDDRFQGLAEIVQNADDAEATSIRVRLRPDDLLVSHNGKPVLLHHVLGLATPWLSTKGDSAVTIGRFGIGLMTLRSLSDTIDVQCYPYHIRLGQPTLSPIAPLSLPAEFQQPGWTTFRIPLAKGTVSVEDILEWFDRWDDSALLFLSHVSRVELLSSDGELLRLLTLGRTEEGHVRFERDDGFYTVNRSHAEAPDGRSWAVYSTEAPSPLGARRARKETGPTTPISVALPLSPVQSGAVYAGLPVTRSRAALFTSAQFDPLASRRGFADNEWNRALVALVAEMWGHAVLDLFTRDPSLAWHTIPIEETLEGEPAGPITQAIEETITERAKHWVASRLAFPVPGQTAISLSELAVESEPLDGILTDAETATLAQLPAAVPRQVRDSSGLWRKVLDDWRQAGVDLPEPVSVLQALDLMPDGVDPIERSIALTAIALDEGLCERLESLPCIISVEGRRLKPPSGDSPLAISVNATPLALQLGIVTILHGSYREDNISAGTVLEWLEACGALIDGTDDIEVVNRLAAAGRAGERLKEPLTDEQLAALRDTFELMNPGARSEVGPDVGRAISLECYSYEGKTVRTVNASPHEAYLPRRIDREPDSFAVSAERTPRLKWISDRYAELLRSPTGRRGVGAQRFLRLLGANTSPILREHPGLQKRFADPRRGLPSRFDGAAVDRTVEMTKYGATYTLQDYDSPDLRAVAEDIARERLKRTRRKRAGALIATLGRAWERALSDFASVDSAFDQYYWQLKGQMRAYWLWEVGDVAWLDDESGAARRPIELRVRTPGNVAIYGDDSSDFLHKELYQPNRRVVLREIGVSSDPSRSELVDRLKQLRNESLAGEDGHLSSILHREAAIVYKALALDLDMPLRSELSIPQLRSEFESGKGLVLTDKGWLPPRSVLAGDPIFGDLAAFAPVVAGTDRLWQLLNMREPTAEDCLKVLQSIARKGNCPEGSDATVLLETMRALAAHYSSDDAPKLDRRRLTRLALWTSQGWTKERPAFATSDPTLARGLRDQIPLWEPGGEIEQFRSVLRPLRIEEIQASDASVMDSSEAWEDSDATALFRAAVGLLREDLARNEPGLAASIKLSWDELEEFEVSVHPSLSLRVRTRYRGQEKDYISQAEAKLDTDQGRMFVRHPLALARVDSGGRALAEVFDGNSRRLAHAWRAACDKAEDGLEARRIVLAKQRADQLREQNEKELEVRVTEFQKLTAGKRRSSAGSKTVSSSAANGRDSKGGPKASDLGPPRTLVDPNSLKIVDRRGRIAEGKKVAGSRSSRGDELVEPQRVSNPPRNRRTIPGYSALDRENVGWELLRRIVSRDDNKLFDTRTQRDVGADAVDSMDSSYELKVSAGSEPDQVTLTRAEVQRAQSKDDFFLVVVSGIEGTDAHPKVRVFVDPLRQLSQTHNGSVTLSGIHAADSLVYEFEPVVEGTVDTRVQDSVESA